MASFNSVIHVRESLEKQIGFSQAVKVGPHIYCAGTVSMDNDGNVLNPGDMAAQIDNIYTELTALLIAHGASAEHVVKETIYTTDMEALLANTSVRLKYFERFAPPAATWVEVSKLAFPGLLLEVDFTAYLP